MPENKLAFPVADVPERFASEAQKKEVAIGGMWLFLATEILFFGGLFSCYLVYRFQYPDVFAKFSHDLNLTLGTVDTGVLLTSSLLMALAVRAAESEKRGKTVLLLASTAALGALFLFIEGSEWYEEIRKGSLPQHSYEYETSHSLGNATGGELFHSLYFSMTGLHGLHVTIGVSLLLFYAALFWKGKTTGTAIEVLGLYWHFVDLVWIFLYPCFYLVTR